MGLFPNFRCDVVAAAVVGFVIIGLVSVGCTIFGIYEIAANDVIFKNDGLGEVLTVLGLYFTVPYVAIVVFFFVQVFHVKCDCFSKVNPGWIIVGFVALLIVGQQAVTDTYLYLLLGPWSLFTILLDIVVFASIFYFRLSPYSGYCYTFCYAVKFALQWNSAYTLKNQAFFGPNGQVAMMFLCIPIVQLPLYMSVLADGSGKNIVDVFVSNFNLFLSHLLNSLDIISMFLFVFTPPHDTDETEGCPAPLRWLIMLQVFSGFVANNCSLLHLFYRRSDGIDTELTFLPKRFRETTSSRDVVDTSADDAARSNQKRMFQYLILMLFTVDGPFFVSRIELWRRRYYPLDIFVAKNVKDLLDIAILLVRTEKQRERLALE
jgi:hypothetical protein